MKKLMAIVTGFILFACLSTAFAQGEQKQFHVGVLGGFVFPNKMKITDTSSNPVSLTDLSLNNSAVFGLKAGYTPNFLNRFLTVELEYSHMFGPNADSQYWFTYQGTAVNVEFNTTVDTISLNLKGRYPEGWFHPYLGVAPGWSWFKFGSCRMSANNRITPAESYSDNKFSYQLLAGVEFDVMQNVSLDLGYKYFSAKPKIGDLSLDVETSLHTGVIGLNIKF